MTAVVHKMKAYGPGGKIRTGPDMMDPLCGGPWRQTTIFAALAHGRGYRWCKRCLKKAKKEES